MTEFKTGDHVRWNTPQGETTGTVVEVIEDEERVGDAGHGGQKVRGSADDPRYEVKSDKSGKRAAHKGSALKKA